MFTGIVEELGEVVAVERGADDVRLTVRGALVTADATYGASIAVDGCCLTVTDLKDDTFTADVMRETLDRTTLGAAATGTRVNLERPVTLATRLGGHLVQGHVDGTATVTNREPGERWDVVTFALPRHLSRYVVEKGSITVDGVSLTVTEAGEDSFAVSLIPATLELTTLGRKGVGDHVNVEVDVVAKHVERLLTYASTGTPAATPETRERTR